MNRKPWVPGMCVIDDCGDDATELIGESDLCKFDADRYNEIVVQETKAGRHEAREDRWKGAR